MHYLGGKSRVATEIATVLSACREGDQVYLEPFVGAGWVLAQMDGKREASDVNPYLIAVYRELQKGWQPPTEVTEDMYQWAEADNGCPDYLRGFIGIACSWGGKWFGGYARDGSGRNYARNGANSLIKIAPLLAGVKFQCVSYIEYSPADKLVYCDPPYAGTTEYSFCGRFDTPLFWETMRVWSQDNVVIISGYNCPDDFRTIYEIPTRTDLRGTSGKMLPRIERLFKYRG